MTYCQHWADEKCPRCSTCVSPDCYPHEAPAGCLSAQRARSLATLRDLEERFSREPPSMQTLTAQIRIDRDRDRILGLTSEAWGP